MIQWRYENTRESVDNPRATWVGVQNYGFDARDRLVGTHCRVYFNNVDGKWWLDVSPSRDGQPYGTSRPQRPYDTLVDAINGAHAAVSTREVRWKAKTKAT